MQSPTPALNHEMKDVKSIDFTLQWDCLASATKIDQNPPECPQCHFVSPQSRCVFCGAQTQAAAFTNNVLVYKTKKESEGKKEASTRVYCIDISGSMQGPRIDYVKDLLKKELSSYVRSNPQDKVCLITFESDCHIIGDGSKPEVLVGCECSFEKIEEFALKNKDLLPIEQSIGKLRDKIDAIQCVGRTASISALTLATSIASFTGGEVFFYTDGMRNKGLPSAGNTDRIIQKATKVQGKEVYITIFFFANCQAFISEYSDCASKTKGDISPIHIGKEKKSGEGQIKRTCVAYELVVNAKASDDIQFEGEKLPIELSQVANNENKILSFTIPQNAQFRQKMSQKIGQKIYAQCKVEYKDSMGAAYKAYIMGSIDVVSTIPQKDVQLVISNKLNQIAELIDKMKWEDARKVLTELMQMDFRIGADANNFFKNAFSELMSYLDHAEHGDGKKDDVVALLNYMKSARKDGIKL